MCQPVPSTCTRPARLAGAVLSLLAVASLACSSSRSPAAPSEPADPPAPPPASAALQVSGTVTAEGDAAPALPGVRVEIVEGSRAGSSTLTDDAGRYQLADLSAGSYTVRASLEGYDTLAYSFELEGNRTLDLALKAASDADPPPDAPVDETWTVSGTVSDATAHAPLSAARVEVIDGPNRGRSETTDASGRYALRDLTAGSVIIRVTLEGYVPASRSLDIAADHALDFTLERPSPPPAPGPALSGHVVDVLSNDPIAGVTVRVDGGGEATTDASGDFSVTGAASGDVQRVALSSPVTVDRQTTLSPLAPAVAVSLIPSTLDLRSFDEMVRARGELHRWVAAPRLIIERRVLAFTGTSEMSYTATAAAMSEAEASGIAADLTAMLPKLTGGAFQAFSSVDVEFSAEGHDVSIARTGAILVARFEGLTTTIATWGYGRWSVNGAGEVLAGVVMLDDSFEQSGSPYRRALRTHEMGHALGYGHVGAAVSVMHSSGRIEPTSFDLSATTIAFRRAPLNRSPDIDPDPAGVSRAAAAATRRWYGAP